MRQLILLALNTMLVEFKDRSTFAVNLFMPAVMMLLLGLAMGGADSTPTITIDVIDGDDSALSAQFVSDLRAELDDGSGSFRLCPYAGSADKGCGLASDLAARPADWSSTADTRLKDTDSYGAILIPAGFGQALIGGNSTSVQFKNSEALSAPTLALQKIDAAISRMNGSVAIASLVTDTASTAFDTAALDRATTFDTVRAQMDSAWNDRPIRVEVSATKASVSTAGFNQSGPGIAAMFVLLSGLGSATVLLYEREQGTLQRLYTLPVRRWQIVAGKLLGRYAATLIYFTVLVVVGAVMGVQWGDNIPGIILIMLIYALTVTALGLALATLVRTSAQGQSIGLLLGLTLSPLGGAWWPLEIVPPLMKTIGHFSPVAWCMDAFQELMFYNGGVVDILPMLGVLLGMTALFFAFGVFNFRYE